MNTKINDLESKIQKLEETISQIINKNSYLGKRLENLETLSRLGKGISRSSLITSKSSIQKAEKISTKFLVEILETYKKHLAENYCNEIINTINSKKRSNILELIDLDMNSWSKDCQSFFISLCETMNIFEKRGIS
ncbi:MAG TPA: hypothetical protein PKD96_02245 [Candidatus Absconditabacterales bacterium]|nr:hypothetical protein [Candidatus Absconditabacterales bacterium]HMT27101.1 hypothetical protein [Candidatus Absconditabacterales bacterium]